MSFAPGGTPDDFYGPDWRDSANDHGWWNPDDMSQAMTDVFNERFRQLDEEGFSHQHDDDNVNGELAKAAASYACSAAVSSDALDAIAGVHIDHATSHLSAPPTWPQQWDKAWWKPKTRRRDLVRAGALILAEIERLDRREFSKK